MTKFVPRSITFTIPTKSGGGLIVTAVEHKGNINFTVDPGTAGDLRGFFFHLNDEALLGTAKILGGGGLITGTKIKANSVIDLGAGNNLKGASTPFDIGIAFGSPGQGQNFINKPVSFTLDTSQPLTLDDIAHVSFGARIGAADKLTFRAPAAPDALNDKVTTHEDSPITIQVLSNDTDADNQQLKITAVQLTGAHGTATISADGKSIIYTPDKNYAGSNIDRKSVDAKFQYAVSDGNGGKDSATVGIHIVPVADKPAVTYEVLAAQDGDAINMIRLKVTATVTDTDGSEFIDRIEFATPPEGYVLTTDGDLTYTAGQPSTVTEYVQLFVPLGQDLNYDLGVTAYAQEKGVGDADEASKTVSQHIGIEFNHNETTKEFLVNDQNIWGPGGEVGFNENFFVGVNAPFSESLDAGIGNLYINGGFKFGLTADFHIEGGAISANLPFDVTIDTTYNKTTDRLFIETDALLTGGGFTTSGPDGYFGLGAILDFAVTFGFNEYAFDNLDTSATFKLNALLDYLGFPSDFVANVSSEDSDLPINWTSLGPTSPLAILLDWPDLTTASSSLANNVISGSATSANFIQFDADVDELAAMFFPAFREIAKLIGPDPNEPDSFEWLDLTASAGAQLIQQFALDVLGLEATLTFENGAKRQFVMGDDLMIADASDLDADGDGVFEFVLSLTPDATLDNTTSIGFNVGGKLEFMKNDPLDIGPITVALSTPLGSVQIGNTGAFDLAFSADTYAFLV